MRQQFAAGILCWRQQTGVHALRERGRLNAMNRSRVLLWLLAAGAAVSLAQGIRLFPVLKSAVLIGKQEGGFFLLSTSQLLRPWGEMMQLPGRPVDAALDSKKRFLAVLNRRNVHLMDVSSGAQLALLPTGSTSYAGVAFRPGDTEVWASETSRNGPDSIAVNFLSADGKPVGKPAHIALEGHPVPAGIAFSADGTQAFVAFSRNNALAVFDAVQRKLIREIPVGMAPFGVVAAKKQARVFVSNRGGRRPKPADVTAPSSGSAIITDPKTGTAATGTISVVDLNSGTVREVEVGLAPSVLALSADETLLAVANGHSDSVSVIDTRTLTRTDVRIPPIPATLIGSQPIAVVFAPEGDTLYVACAGTNAVTVVRREKQAWKVAGAIPTAWFPTALAVAADGSLRVVCLKGAGETADPRGHFNSKNYVGALLKIPRPAPVQLAAGTREVEAANTPRFEPAGGVENLAALGIRHVFLIIKENRTYDQVFGDMGKGNGDPNLAIYGREVTPNHHALAEKYVLLDNFYTGGAISFDGHHWLMMGQVSDYVERAFAASPRGYAWNMADSLTVSPAGFFWQGGRPVNVRVYGEFCLPGRWDPATQNVVDMNEGALSWSEHWRLYKEGKWRDSVACKPGVPALAPLQDRRYPFSSTSVPDQMRADAFIGALAEFEKAGNLPDISIIHLNSDHTSGTRPGSPTPRAMVADNDLALGRVVEAISKSRFWRQSLILVVEDDAQDGFDHVDGRRTVAMAIGPFIRRGAVDSNYYTHLSMVRTIQDIFRIPPRTRYLAAARAMTSVFTTTPDYSSYQHVVPKIPLDEMNPPLKALRGRRLWAAQQCAAMNWAEPDDVPQETLNRILWWDAKGYDAPYPETGRHR